MQVQPPYHTEDGNIPAGPAGDVVSAPLIQVSVQSAHMHGGAVPAECILQSGAVVCRRGPIEELVR